MIHSPYLIQPGKKFKLSDLSTNDKGRFKDKHGAAKAIKENLQKFDKLQEVLYAQGKHAILIVFQAMDGGGKDGSISHVFKGVNPQGCTVSSFKEPTPLELSHDFLWRIHAHVPPRGMIGIFNRSHYESILVERVKKLVPEKIWSGRYDQINQFEFMLAQEGVTILKFFLNISWEEQKERMERRLADPTHNWKFSAADLKERRRWDGYMEAYHDALQRCSTPWAPWYAVPADHKWFRNWVISDTIIRTLEKLDLQYPPPMKDADKVKVK